jgi:hypothetical protein
MLGLNPWVLLALVVAWLASLAGAVTLGYSYKEGEVAKETLLVQQATEKIKEANQKHADDVGVLIETGLSKIRITNKTINNEVQREREIHYKTLDNPDCNLPDTTRGLLLRARGHNETGPSPGQPAGGVRTDGKPAESDKAGGSGGR